MLPDRSRRRLLIPTAVTFALLAAASAHAGGSAENALLIINPTSKASMYLGHYYQQARGIPAANILYMSPDASNYTSFTAANLDGFLGTLDERGIAGTIDYVIVAPGGSFFVDAPGLVTDGCSPVNRFAIGSAYTMAFIKDDVLNGSQFSRENEYYSAGTDAMAFSSNTRWLNGQPSMANGSERYYIGAMLGYTGPRGNSFEDIIAMIDRSVAVDGTRPGGTFYFMRTTDDLRSAPRHGLFPAAITAIEGLGGQAEEILDVLPVGRHDGLGIMTGWADPDIAGADMTITDGAFCDHLTSFAGAFNFEQQTKMSQWITKGASGSVGAVEEPCNYTGKFPRPNTHAVYFQGLSLGEAYLRNAEFTPFQMLLYGDPLTRPFAYLPVVDVPDAPVGPVSGVVALNPTASTDHPTGDIDSLDLLIDGVVVDTIAPGGTFNIDTTLLSDGHHDVRVLAADDTPVRSIGRWVGSLTVNNLGRSASISVAGSFGNLSDLFDFTLDASGGAVDELRLVQGSRVLATVAPGDAALSVYGQVIGGNTTSVQAEALFDDGSLVRSAPIDVTITLGFGGPAGNAPIAYDYTRIAPPNQGFVVELPASFDDDLFGATYAVITPPAQASVYAGPTQAYRVLVADPGAEGLDTMTFQVTTPSGASNVATVTLDFGDGLCPTGCVTPPTDFGVQFGAYQGGDLDDLASSDNQYVVIQQRPATSPLFPLIRVSIGTTAVTDSATELRFVLEARSNALPASVPQRVRMFNFQSFTFDQIDDRIATRTDSVAEIVIANPNDFIRAGTGEMFGDMSWWDPGAVFSPNWGAFIDQAVWVVFP